MHTKNLIRANLALSAVIALLCGQTPAEAQVPVQQCWFKFSIGWTPYDWDETGLGHYYGKPPAHAGYGFPEYVPGRPHGWVIPPSSPPPENEGPPPGAALVIVKLPDEAELWFDETRTVGDGSYRRFVTPPLEPGRQFVYTLRVRWNIKDAELTRVEKVRVEPGKSVTVNFLTVDSWTGVRAETLPIPRKLP